MLPSLTENSNPGSRKASGVLRSPTAACFCSWAGAPCDSKLIRMSEAAETPGPPVVPATRKIIIPWWVRAGLFLVLAGVIAVLAKPAPKSQQRTKVMGCLQQIDPANQRWASELRHSEPTGH